MCFRSVEALETSLRQPPWKAFDYTHFHERFLSLQLWSLGRVWALTSQSGILFHAQDPRGNFHLLTNVNTCHRRCPSGMACGGHAFSRDGLHFSNLTIGAFGPTIRFQNGTYWYNSYVERPFVAQDPKTRIPLAFYVGMGRTSYHDRWGILSSLQIISFALGSAILLASNRWVVQLFRRAHDSTLR